MADTKKVDPIQGEILHEYDGILEADNRLPNWWLATFFGAIIFAGVYWGWYEAFHVTPDTRAAYAAEMMARAGDLAEPTDELLTTAASDPGVVASGRSTFEAQCVVCHSANGEGLVGPNLTDAQWIHGGSPMAIYTTVHDGVLARGMPVWAETLPPRTMLNVVAYVLSIQNTNVAGRAPEGELGGTDNGWITAPTEAAPTEAAPTEAAPTEAAPTEAAPTEAAPTEAAPTEAAPTEAAPTEAAPTEAAPTEAAPTEAAPTEAAPTEAAPTEAAPTEAAHAH